MPAVECGADHARAQYHCRPPLGRGAADALARRDDDARNLALERAQDELLLLVVLGVEADPVDLGLLARQQCVVDQRRRIARVADLRKPERWITAQRRFFIEDGYFNVLRRQWGAPLSTY